MDQNKDRLIKKSSAHITTAQLGPCDTEPPHKTMGRVDRRLNAFLVHDDAPNKDHEHHNDKH